METRIITCDRCGKETINNYDKDRRRLTIYIQKWGCQGEEIFRYDDICEDCEKEIRKIFKI